MRILSGLVFFAAAAAFADAPASAPASAAAAPASAPAAVKISKAGTNDCNKNPVVDVTGASGKVLLTGPCTSVTISGNKADVGIESAVTLTISGKENKVLITKVDTLAVSGGKNTVTWVGTVDASKTDATVNDTGKGNTIKKGDAAAADAAKDAAKNSKEGKAAGKKVDDAAKKALGGLKIP